MKKCMKFSEIEETEAYKSLLLGRWTYEGCSNDFYSAYLGDKLERSGDMSNELYFGDNFCGTDLKSSITYSSDMIKFNSFDEEQIVQFNKILEGRSAFSDEVLQDKELQEKLNNIPVSQHSEFRYILAHRGTTLIMFEEAGENDMNEEKDTEKKIRYHVYSSYGERDFYSQEEIEKLCNKKDSQIVEFNNPNPSKALVGTWKIYDMLKESKLDGYDGSFVFESEPMYALSPMFDKIVINKKGKCKVLHGDKIQIMRRNDTPVVLTPKNTIMQFYTSKEDENKFIIYNHLIDEKYEGVYKKFENGEYFIIDLNNFHKEDNEVFVFKKK